MLGRFLDVLHEVLEDAARQEVLEDTSQGYVNDPHERVLILDDPQEVLEDAARQEVQEDASQGYVNDPHECVLILDDMCEVFDPGNAPVDLIVDTSRNFCSECNVWWIGC